MRNRKGIRSLLGALLGLASFLAAQAVWARQPEGGDAAEEASVLDNSNCPPDPNPAVTPPRCPWYVRAEGVMLLRDAEDATNVAALGNPSNIVLSTRELDSPFKGGPRLLIGHTLNPWNQIEFSYFGLEHWSDTVAIRDDTNNALGAGNLASPFSNFGDPAVQGLDYNDFVSIAAKSTLDNGEFNWRHVLDMPPGRLSTSLLVGGRFMSIREGFRYESASALPAPLGSINTLFTHTSNKLFGLQLGALLEVYSEGRWWVNFEMKGAICQNEAKLDTDFARVDNNGVATEFLGQRTKHGTSWVGDIALTVVYRFSPRVNARFGYQAIWVTGLALADENFQRDVNILTLGPPQVNNTGTVVYHGPFAGIELAW